MCYSRGDIHILINVIIISILSLLTVNIIWLRGLYSKDDNYKIAFLYLFFVTPNPGVSIILNPFPKQLSDKYTDFVTEHIVLFCNPHILLYKVVLPEPKWPIITHI